MVSGTAFGVPFERVEPLPPPFAADLKAALVVLVLTVLVGPPLGLLWSQLAPRVEVQIVGEDANLTETYTDGFIAADAGFLAAVALAGLVGGLLAWWFGSAHGPAVVLALAAGGLVAAYVAMTLGQQVGVSALREAVAAGEGGRFLLPLELKAKEALVGWPLASMLAYLSASLVRGR